MQSPQLNGRGQVSRGPPSGFVDAAKVGGGGDVDDGKEIPLVLDIVDSLEKDVLDVRVLVKTAPLKGGHSAHHLPVSFLRRMRLRCRIYRIQASFAGDEDFIHQ